MRFIIASFLVCCLAFSQTTINRAHYDAGQAGVNTAETLLTPSSVTRIHRLGSWSIDGYVSAQPLYLPAAISGKNVLIAATWSGYVYAFDANKPGTAAIWSRQFANPRGSYPNSSNYAFAYSQPLGIVSTPYADTAGGFLYLVVQDTTPQYTLYQLNLTTGATIQSVVVSGSVPGTGDPVGGDCVSGGILSFCASAEFINRPGLVVANSKVYVAFGSTDINPWHGWVVAYNTADFTRAAIWCATPNGSGASTWSPGAAPAVDGSGNLYFTTGNGDYDGVTGFGESVVKLSPTLTLLDWFTPSNWAALNTNDEDVASNHFTLIPGTTKGFFAAKDYQAYVIDTADMGHLQGTGTAPQTWDVCSGCEKGKNSGGYSQIYLNGVWYLATTGNDFNGGAKAGSLYAFAFNGSTFNTTPVATNINTWPFPGPAQIAGTSNGATSNIIWAVTGSSQTFSAPADGTLRAFNTSLTELWSSANGVQSDSLGLLAKYIAPVVANGNVYVATQSGQIVVYGFPSVPKIADGIKMKGSIKIQ